LKVVPDFAVSIGGSDLTATIRKRLTRLVVTDNSGEEADTVELTLDDRDGAIATPRKGVSLKVSIGYRGAALVSCGEFVVDEVEWCGPPDTLTIRGKSADMRASLKAPKRRHWRDTTLKRIVSKIATEHGLTPAISASLGAKAVAHMDQTNESDMHFLTRLGRDFGAVATPKAGRLVFAPAGEAVSTSGKSLPAVKLKRTDLDAWRACLADRSAHGTVRARWRDVAAATTKFEKVGSGEPVKTLRHTYRDAAHAKAAAEAEAKRLKRNEATLEVEMPGRPELAAQAPLELSGLRTDVDGRWIAEKVEHELDFEDAGYVTRVEAKRV
jgi:phage protein D